MSGKRPTNYRKKINKSAKDGTNRGRRGKYTDEIIQDCVTAVEESGHYSAIWKRNIIHQATFYSWFADKTKCEFVEKMENAVRYYQSRIPPEVRAEARDIRLDMLRNGGKTKWKQTRTRKFYKRIFDESGQPLNKGEKNEPWIELSGIEEETIDNICKRPPPKEVVDFFDPPEEIISSLSTDDLIAELEARGYKAVIGNDELVAELYEKTQQLKEAEVAKRALQPSEDEN